MLLYCLHILASCWYWVKSPKPSSALQCLSIAILELWPGETTVWEEQYFHTNLTQVHEDCSAHIQANCRAAQLFPTQVYYIGTSTYYKRSKTEQGKWLHSGSGHCSLPDHLEWEGTEGRGVQAGLQRASWACTGAEVVPITHPTFEQLSNIHLGDISIELCSKRRLKARH